MSDFSLANSLSISVRVYRALLAAYPKKFRDNYETHMVQVFRDSFRDAYRDNGTYGVIDLWLHTCADLVVTALIERITERSRYMFSPRLMAWCGIACIFSGLFWLISMAGGPPLKVALALELFGLVGLQMMQVGQGGKIGLAGFALGIIGTGLAIAYMSQDIVSQSFPYMEREPTLVAPVSLALFIQSIGLALLGVTSLRAKNPHRWRGLPLGLSGLSAISGAIFWLIVYVPLSHGQFPWQTRLFMLYPALLVLLTIGWMGLGVLLASEANPESLRSSSPSA